METWLTNSCSCTSCCFCLLHEIVINICQWCCCFASSMDMDRKSRHLIITSCGCMCNFATFSSIIIHRIVNFFLFFRVFDNSKLILYKHSSIIKQNLMNYRGSIIPHNTNHLPPKKNWFEHTNTSLLSIAKPIVALTLRRVRELGCILMPQFWDFTKSRTFPVI